MPKKEKKKKKRRKNTKLKTPTLDVYKVTNITRKDAPIIVTPDGNNGLSTKYQPFYIMILSSHPKKKKDFSMCLDSRCGRLRFRFQRFPFFLFFSFLFTCFRETIITIVALFMYCSNTVHGTTTTLFRKNKKIKMGHTVLFTYFKIILLQYFQFSVSEKISYIQTEPLYQENSMEDQVWVMLFVIF